MLESSTPVTPVLELSGLEHTLKGADGSRAFTLTVDRKITVNSGSFTALLGPSGCGKTTLLSILGLLRRPAKVDLFNVNEVQDSDVTRTHNIADLWRRNDHATIERLRRKLIGFALQSGDLVASLTVRENIALPLGLNGFVAEDCKNRVDYLLHAFGLDVKKESSSNTNAGGGNGTSKKKVSTLAESRINTLSGGEYQRACLARAIAHRPQLTFVDEPTSALNREKARAALDQLKASSLSAGNHGAVIMITHDEQLACEFADQIIHMIPDQDGVTGRLKSIMTNTPTRTGAVVG